MITHANPGINVCVRTMFFPLYFISGVLVPAVYIPHAILPILLLNPFLHLAELIRSQVFSDYEPVEGVSVEYVMVMALVLLFISMAFTGVAGKAISNSNFIVFDFHHCPLSKHKYSPASGRCLCL